MSIFVVIACPVFADNIMSNNNDCDNGTLTTYSGSVELEADWSANNVDITFYNGDSEYTTGQCTYDGTLTLPSTDPTKDGYTFDGWKVRRVAAAQCSLVDLVITSGFALDSENIQYISQNGNNTWGNTTGLNPGEFRAIFDDGTMKATSLCSAWGGDEFEGDYYFTNKADWSATDNEVNNANGIKRYCWCKVIDYKSNNNETCDVSTASWVLRINDFLSESDCISNCTFSCVDLMDDDAWIRALVGTVGVYVRLTGYDDNLAEECEAFVLQKTKTGGNMNRFLRRGGVFPDMFHSVAEAEVFKSEVETNCGTGKAVLL